MLYISFHHDIIAISACAEFVPCTDYRRNIYRDEPEPEPERSEAYGSLKDHTYPWSCSP